MSPKYVFGNYLPQMVPMDLNMGETKVLRYGFDSGPLFYNPFFFRQALSLF